MSENAGAIVYTVDADVAKFVDNMKTVDTTLDQVEKGLDKVDGQNKKTSESTGLVTKATEEESAALRKLLAQIDPLVGRTQRLEDMNRQLGDAFDKGLLSAKQYDAELAKLDVQYLEIARDAAKAADATKKLTQGQNDSAASSTKAATEASKFGTALAPLAVAVAGVVTLSTLKNWGMLAEQFTLLQSRIARLTPDVTTASTTYNKLLGVAAQTGQTVPATVKLWETLTASLKSLGATNDQVLTLTGTLQKIGKIGGSSAEETANALRQLGQSLAGGTLRAEEYNSIVEQTPELIRTLAKQSGMSMGQFRQAMLDGKISAEMLFDLLTKSVGQVDTEFKKLPRSVSDAANAITVQFGAALAVIDNATKASKALAFALDGVAKGLKLTFNPDDQQKFADLINKRAIAEQQYQAQLDAGLTQTAKGTKARIDGYNAEIKAMQDRRVEEQKEESKKSGPKGPATVTTDGQKVLQQLGEENQLLRANGVERAKIAALYKVGAGATQSEKDAAVALAVENYNLAESQKAVTKAKNAEESEAARAAKAQEKASQQAIIKENEEARKGYEANQKALQGLADALEQAGMKGKDLAEAQNLTKLNKFAEPEDIAKVKELSAAIYALNQLKADKANIGSVDPIAGEQLRYETELETLQRFNAEKLLSDQAYLDAKMVAESEHDVAVTALQEAQFRRQGEMNAFLMDSINSLGSATTSTIAGLVSGTLDGTKAMQNFANTILTQAVGAVVDLGVQQVKAALIGRAAQAAAGAAYAGAVGAQVQVTTALAAQAAFASTAAIPVVGPAAAPAAAAAAGTIAAGLGAPAAALAPLAGARMYGGGVGADGMYKINEGGGPEVFNAANGQQFMLPNQRGEVVSNKDASSGGGMINNISITVNSDGSSSATGDGDGSSRQLADTMKMVVIDTLQREQRPGGILWGMQNGRAV